MLFLFSHGVTAGDRSRAQHRPFSEIIGPLSCQSDPSLSSRIHIGQKQLSHIYGQEQGQCWCHCDLTATLQILSLFLQGCRVCLVKLKARRPAHFWHITLIFPFPICASTWWTFSLARLSSLTVSTSLFRWVSPCESSLSWEIKCESVCFHIVVCYSSVTTLFQVWTRLYQHRLFATLTLWMLLISTSLVFYSVDCYPYYETKTVNSHQQFIPIYHVAIRGILSYASFIFKFYTMLASCQLRYFE